MNKYNQLLNSTTGHAEGNHCMVIKLKYESKLFCGMHVSNPIHIEYAKEFEEFSFQAIRKIIKKNYKSIEELKQLKAYLIEDNAIKYFELFNKDIKYNNR